MRCSRRSKNSWPSRHSTEQAPFSPGYVPCPHRSSCYFFNHNTATTSGVFADRWWNLQWDSISALAQRVQPRNKSGYEC